ncbi:hypothetical protein MNV49_006813 [Pseudohyphozyma bogoriensis]|nr:hypothetical protein MNV49_006813 [Pseudohyphozyma bogoriensis]
MSHFTLSKTANNPVETSHLLSALSYLSPKDGPTLTLPSDQHASYTAILAGVHDSFTSILEMEDYVPEVDEERFPRRDVKFPTEDENPTNAWAWKANVKDTTGKSKGGLLEGKTVCLKDNVGLKGVPALLGTDMFEGWVPTTDATIVTRILEAGGEITGKAVCENYSMFAASFSAATGKMDNAVAPGFSAGGSSSGTAVLVAKGLADLGIGGDQGGSIRIPATHNGIVGMKPTTGLVPYTGIGTLEPVIDHTGPMTKNVLDNALLLQAIAGADGIDDRQLAGTPFPDQVPDYVAIAEKGIKGLKVGIITESLSVATHDPRVSAQVVKAANKLKAQGAVVEEVSIPGHLIAPELFLVNVRLSATNVFTGKATGRRGYYMNDLASKILPLTQEKLDKFWPSLVVNLTNGAYAYENLDPTLYGKAMNLARKVRDEYNAALSKYDVLVTPTMPWLPKTFPADDATPLEKLSKCAGVSLNTCPFNLTGHPAISIPVGMLASLEAPDVKLPNGMQIIGKYYDEGTIYRVARAFEKENDWTKITE